MAEALLSALETLADTSSALLAKSDVEEGGLTDGAESMASTQSASERTCRKRKATANAEGDDDKASTTSRNSSASNKRSKTATTRRIKRRDSTLGELGPGVSQSKGRFLKSEKKILFNLIREDPGLFHAFLHQRKERMYGTKSWMHEIAQRYNRLATDKRSLEAIRHHLMFRKTSATRSDKNSERVLLEHAKQCDQSDTCTKCLIFQRSCVQSGVARCGYVECTECDKVLPHVSTMISGDQNELSTLLSPTRPSSPSAELSPLTVKAEPKTPPRTPSLDASLLLQSQNPVSPLRSVLETSLSGIPLYPSVSRPSSVGLLPLLNMGISPTASSAKTFFGTQPAGGIGLPSLAPLPSLASLNTSGLLASMAPKAAMASTTTLGKSSKTNDTCNHGPRSLLPFSLSDLTAAR
ncbi:Myb_DNA-bind_5 domain-containing protein [Durusdinium trenchii]|uniref:Myb_DNA-bind_5 domain-containing protein n=1 Tax=Durusdinium trenchii TaxID=1381693 RepID=A0ABP0I905_9DINO